MLGLELGPSPHRAHGSDAHYTLSFSHFWVLFLDRDREEMVIKEAEEGGNDRIKIIKCIKMKERLNEIFCFNT